MVLDAWLPIGLILPDGAKIRSTLFSGGDWQIYDLTCGGRALVVLDSLAQRWLEAGTIEGGTFATWQFGERVLRSISSASSQTLSPVQQAKSPDNKDEALAFGLALKATRSIDAGAPLQDAIYVEKITRLLPTYSISTRMGDDVVLGYWLTGGMSIPATSFRRLSQSLSWLGVSHLKEVVQKAGIKVPESTRLTDTAADIFDEPKTLCADEPEDIRHPTPEPNKVFELPGRPELETFINEHIIDIVLNRDRYQVLGIGFPSAVILHGPPGCGKTFAVERLVDFLGWPSFEIDAASVASPYIHETSKKVSEVFDRAINNSPSVIVIDEMEAFLADREMGAGHHRVEEMAEFLRRIPEAVQNDVLIIAMTNRIDMVDLAIQRRGRFDHVIKVDFASEVEVHSLLDKLLSSLPKESDVDSKPLARELAGRPLSDVSFVVREGARIAARSGKGKLDQASLLFALGAAPARGAECGKPKRPIGFV